MSRAQKFVMWCDKSMVFSFYALVYFLPISIALTEIFTVTALISYLVKRSAAFCAGMKVGSACSDRGRTTGWHQASLPIKAWNFLKAFQPIDNCLNRPVALLLGINFFSIFISRYPSVSFEGFLGKTLQSAFLYFNFIECMNSIKRVKIFLIVLFVSGSLICVNGLYQYFVVYEFIRGHIFDGRISSSLLQANDFAAYLVVVTPVLFCLVVSKIFISRRNGYMQNADLSFL